MSDSKSYRFQEIEAKWQKRWVENQLYRVDTQEDKPKYYTLDMFPYPSGSGLHVGHPLGYIASDIVSRFKRLNGFNVLHPMGYDAFGLPAEQYAIQTGQHPAVTTEANIKRFREQLDKMGFSFDWSRQVKTCDPNYYQWTQWIFSLFFTHWYDKSKACAEPIEKLINSFETEGNHNISAHSPFSEKFSADEWNASSAEKQMEILNHYRLAFIDETTVNWCAELGTVLANEEVVNGVSERGGYPVVRKKMKQWSLRITAYADRLLSGLDTIDWSDSIKEIQRNWIGRSEGAEIDFKVNQTNHSLRVFTTRPDTLFGATYMVIAPEHELLQEICSEEQRESVISYAEKAKNRSEIDRMADTSKTGVFTGAYAINPFTNQQIPVWTSDYVLASYGTGAIMAVPAHDERDFEFAKTFELPITAVIKPENEEITLPLTEALSSKEGICFDSGFLNGLKVKDAIKKAIEEVENREIGTKKINYKLREAGFGRQRYWGEPFPIVYQNEQPELVKELPVELPEVESYKPTGTGESPLAAVSEWVNSPEGLRETDTMPGWAGSSWYFLRYTDPNNSEAFASKEALSYWKNVDLYVGGSEHATGHLLYSRFWTKFLYDLGYLSWDEPFQKLVNQGMIMGEDGQKMSKRWGNVVNPMMFANNMARILYVFMRCS
jgi:leucyl-tRNA synthetase